MRFKEYLGIILGAAYGLLIRLIMSPHDRGSDELYNFYNIYSVSFIWILPIVISIIPVLIAKNSIKDS